MESLIEQYISDFPVEAQKALNEVRDTIKASAPEVVEAIKWGMPTFVLDGHNLVHFAGYKNHIGFYPDDTGIAAFKDELSVYKGAKGSVQFPLDEPMPLDLIARIVKYRVKETMDPAKNK